MKGAKPRTLSSSAPGALSSVPPTSITGPAGILGSGTRKGTALSRGSGPEAASSGSLP